MQTWEYHVTTINLIRDGFAADYRDLLKDAGSKGWELVTTNQVELVLLITMKRPLVSN